LNKKLFEEKISSSKIFNGEILKFYFDKVRLPNGNIATREKISHPGAVGIVPITKDNRVLLVRQYRYPINDITVEIPAGKIDEGESPKLCARRELAEEVGAVDGKMKSLLSFYTSPGFCDELLHLFLATGFNQVKNDLDDNEFLDILDIGLETAQNWINEGKIKDSKTIIGILMAGNFLQNGQE